MVALDPAMADEIRRIGRIWYPDEPIGPNINQFNDERTEGTPSAKVVLDHLYGRDVWRTEHWNEFLRSAGLRPPTHSEAHRARNRRRKLTQRQPLTEAEVLSEILGMRLAELRARQDEFSHGHRCIQRTRPILKWCVRTHCYVPVGRQTVYELR